MNRTRRRIARGGRTTAAAVALAVVLTGCASDDGTAPDGGSDAADGGTGDDAGGGGQGDDADPPADGGSIGASDSPCPLPVTFSLAESWAPEQVQVQDDGTDHFARRSGVGTLSCEIDAKPAGNIGYLSVWSGEATGDSAEQVLESYMAEERRVVEEEYRQVEAGDFPDAAEVVYEKTSSLDDGTKRERALAVTTDDGVALLHLGGLDTEEHEEMLPAYELAKATLSAS